MNSQSIVIGRHGRVVRRRTATPRSPVRILGVALSDQQKTRNALVGFADITAAIASQSARGGKKGSLRLVAAYFYLCFIFTDSTKTKIDS